MTKRVKDLTVEEMTQHCRKTECYKCPLHTEKGSAVIPDCVAIGCSFEFFFKNITDYLLKREVDVDE